jgi:GT2 family glycosyltransferase
MPTISFIVPLYNHLSQSQAMMKTLKLSLPSWLDYEIILINDYSTDETQSWLEQLNDSRIHGFSNNSNQGYAYTNNHGVNHAKGEYLGFLNNDLLFKIGWFEPMFKILTDPVLNAGLVGNIQCKVADRLIDHAGVNLSLAGDFTHIKNFNNNIEYQKVPWVTGACILMRRDFFLQLGGFDTCYRNGCEDIDLCFKVKKAKKSVFISHRSSIEHYVSLSRGERSLQNERNSQTLFHRWRREIKSALAQCWTQTLQNNGAQSFLEQYLEGQFPFELLETPHLAGLIIAEMILIKKETYWAETLSLKSPPFYS